MRKPTQTGQLNLRVFMDTRPPWAADLLPLRGSFRFSLQRSNGTGSRLLQRYIGDCQNSGRPRLFTLETLRQLDRALQLIFCQRPHNHAQSEVRYVHASNLDTFLSPKLSVDVGVFSVELLGRIGSLDGFIKYLPRVDWIRRYELGRDTKQRAGPVRIAYVQSPR